MSTSALVCSPSLGMHTQSRYQEGGTPEEVEVQLFNFPFFCCQTPSRTPTSLVLPATPWSPSACLGTALFLSPPRVSRVDFVSLLPPEVAVKVLSYLSPEDLCRSCLVSHAWFCMAQVPPLRRRRQQYVQTMRKEYRRSKENYAPSGRSPQSGSRRSTHRSMTVAQTPLRAIQPQGSIRRGSITSSPAALYTPGPAYVQTPVSTNILEDTQRMSVDEYTGAAEVRRKLFLDSDSPLPAPKPKSRHGLTHIPEAIVRMKTSRSRLKRL